MDGEGNLHEDDLEALYTHLLTLRDQKGAKLDQQTILKHRQEFQGYDCEDSDELDDEICSSPFSDDVTYVSSKHNRYAILIPRKNIAPASKTDWLRHYELQQNYNVVFRKVGDTSLKVGKRRIILASRRPPIQIYDSFEDNRKRLGVTEESTICALKCWNYAIYLEVIDTNPISRLTPLLLATQIQLPFYKDSVIDPNAERIAENMQWQLKDFAQSSDWLKMIFAKEDLESKINEEDDSSTDFMEPSLSKVLEYQTSCYDLEPEEALRLSKMTTKHEEIAEADDVLVVNSVQIDDENPHWFQPIDGDRQLNTACIQTRIYNKIRNIQDDEEKLLNIARRQRGTWTCNVGLFVERNEPSQMRNKKVQENHAIVFERDPRDPTKAKMRFPKLMMADIFTKERKL